MKVTNVTDLNIEFSGKASEFAMLARLIKKSRAKIVVTVSLDGGDYDSIRLTCEGVTPVIGRSANGIFIKYSEATKNELYSLISMPSDAVKGSLHTISVDSHQDLFASNSMGMVLFIE